ncbi:MAG: hypothetical protein M0R33_04400 [Methylomonas sp.]|uniref:glycine-rich domain-containing protein n=1 Tax=Methylomonas sp. TaxID=418 RepID=UPI0025FBC78A|nr:hypothetical protein [Methylomonas sp.]MCK9605676.1 hypothetical protein [Methylomonas sp.]
MSEQDFALGMRALRQYFLAYLQGGCRFVSMPSRLTDDYWHEFILYTRHYQLFCHKAFGRFFHHTPAVVLGKSRQNNVGLRRMWWFCCQEEGINPKNPSRLPLLFALDSKLNVPDGFVYTVDCSHVRKSGNERGTVVYCGGDFSSTDFDGASDGFFDSDSGSDSGGDAGCGGGCGGD